MAKQQVIRTEYADGSVILSNIRNKKGIPFFRVNDTYTATKVTEWYDGTPMDSGKADGLVYLQHRTTEEFFQVNLPNFGEGFLEKDNMAQMRTLSSTEMLLLRMGYYKGVNLSGYYAKGDTPAPIHYEVSNDGLLEDDGGSVIEVGSLKLKHDFEQGVNVKYFGAVENTGDYSDLFSYIVNTFKTIIFDPNTSYVGGISVNTNDVSVVGSNSNLTGDISTENNISTLSTTSTVNSPNNTNQIEVSDSTGFTVGDWIQLSDNLDYIENLAKEPPRELNIVKGVLGNVITLEKNTRNLYTAGSSVVQVNPVFNFSVTGLNFRSYNLWNIVNLSFSKVVVTNLSIVTFAENVNISTVINNPLYTTSNIFLKGVNEGTLNIEATNGKDSVKLFGCANLSASIHVKNAENRGIWLYGCNNINSSDWSIIGSRVHIDANFEILIFDYSKNCVFSKGTLNEENKYSSTSTGPQPIEFRMYSDTCKVVDSTIYNKGSGIIFTYKASAMNCGVENSTIHINPKATPNAIYICELVGDEAGKYPSVVQPRSSLIFTGNKVYYTGSSNIMIMRSASNATFSTPYPSIDISNNEVTVPTAVRVFVANVAPQIHTNIFIRNNKFYGVSGQTLHYIVGTALATIDNLFIKDNYLDNISAVRYDSINSIVINKLYVNNINDPYRKSATTPLRPTKGLTKGYNIFDETLKKPLWWDGTTWIDSTPNASISSKGLVNQSTAVSDITAPTVTTIEEANTAIQTLVAAFNAKLDADRNSGQQEA